MKADNNYIPDNISDRLNKSRENCKYCCNKLATYDWLEAKIYTEKNNIPEIVEVRFKSTKKLFCRNNEQLPLKVGDLVVVETSTGNDIGIVSLSSNLVQKQMKKKASSADSSNILNIIRKATERDIQQWEALKTKEYEYLLEARKIANSLKLQMKINDVEIQADGKKTTFYYTADGRIDFRELIKSFAKAFRNKIEMRQIGIRQESGRIGGIADCGKEMCCSVWLTEFSSVPTIAAKQQNLYLNPAKLSGQCGRLKCCLNYELDNYMEAFEKFPPEDIILKTKKGNARVFKIDILKGQMYFVFEKDYQTQPLVLGIKKVFEVMEMNKKNLFPPDLNGFAEKNTVDKSQFSIPEENY